MKEKRRIMVTVYPEEKKIIYSTLTLACSAQDINVNVVRNHINKNKSHYMCLNGKEEKIKIEWVQYHQK